MAAGGNQNIYITACKVWWSELIELFNVHRQAFEKPLGSELSDAF